MTDADKLTYMEALWAKILTWLAIEETRSLTGLEKIMSGCQCNEYDHKVAIGWPDVSEI
jgi:hypothetical protein